MVRMIANTSWHKALASSGKVLIIAVLGLSLAGCNISAGINNFGQMMQHLQSSLNPIWRLLIASSYVIGIFFVTLGIFKLKKYGQMTVFMMSHANITEPLTYISIGTALLFTPTLLNASLYTLWGYGMNDFPAYSGTGFKFADSIIGPSLDLIKLIGLVAFIRGWILLARLGTQGTPPGTFGKGLTHIVGGLLGINIVGTIDVLKNTFM